MHFLIPLRCLINNIFIRWWPEWSVMLQASFAGVQDDPFSFLGTLTLSRLKETWLSPRSRACPAVLHVCEWDLGRVGGYLCKRGHLSCSQGLINYRRSLLGDQSHPLGVCSLRLVALSVSPLIPFVICQTRVSEAHSGPVRCTFFLPSLVTTSANFRRSAHLAGLQPLAWASH